VLIIGGGAAALVGALEARKAVDDVVIVCKSKVGGSGNTIVSAAQFWQGDSIVRSEESLQEARLKVKGCRLALGKCSVSTFAHIVELLQVQRMGITAEAIVASALQRTESRGAHYREDFSSSDENWLGSIKITKSADGLRLDFVPKSPPAPGASSRDPESRADPGLGPDGSPAWPLPRGDDALDRGDIQAQPPVVMVGCEQIAFR